jgi:hypothetical protein
MLTYGGTFMCGIPGKVGRVAGSRTVLLTGPADTSVEEFVARPVQKLQV